MAMMTLHGVGHVLLCVPSSSIVFATLGGV
jgi:hypothetical protein